MSPHETLFLESTASCDVSNNLSNRLVQFQTWDFGGDVSLQSDVYCNTTPASSSSPPLSLPLDVVFRSSHTLVYVIDAQEEDYEDALPQLAETIWQVGGWVTGCTGHCTYLWACFVYCSC